MTSTINISSYLDSLKSIRCQIVNGRQILAKPLLLIAILDLIDKDLARDNQLSIDLLQTNYNNLMPKYGVDTPFQYPTYFLVRDGFYHLTWRGEAIKTHTPSAKMIRENVLYAYLDNVLWDLLQDKETRDMFRNTIEKYFMK